MVLENFVTAELRAGRNRHLKRLILVLGTPQELEGNVVQKPLRYGVL